MIEIASLHDARRALQTHTTPEPLTLRVPYAALCLGGIGFYVALRATLEEEFGRARFRLVLDTGNARGLALAARDAGFDTCEKIA